MTTENEEQQRIASITAAGKRTPTLAKFLAQETGIDAEMANAVFIAAYADLDAAASQRTDPPAVGKTDAAAGWAKAMARVNQGVRDPGAIATGEVVKKGWASAVSSANRRVA